MWRGSVVALVFLATCVWTAPQVSIVMDDLGFNLWSVKATAALPCQLTGSIIPSTRHAALSASILHAAGKEVFIHMPMTARRTQEETDPLLIRPRLVCSEITRRIHVAISLVPHAVGMNNHEGGFATTNRETMDCVMNALPRRLMFLDSSTTPKTKAWMAARDAGLPWSRCNRFLLGETPEDLADSFQDALETAKRKGRVVVIAHPYKVALDELPELIRKAKRQGFKFIPVTETRR